jgi:hypothetical protein
LQASICRGSPNAATAPRDATTSVDVLREFITAVPAKSVPPRHTSTHCATYPSRFNFIALCCWYVHLGNIGPLSCELIATIGFSTNT